MTQRFTVRTDKGRPDNLKEPVKLAFTLTPFESENDTCQYEPLARWVTNFTVNGGQTVNIDWDWSTVFANYTVGLNSVCSKGGLASSPVVLPGQSLTLPASLVWPAPAAYDDPEALRQGSMTMINQSGSTQHVLLTRATGGAIVAYRPLKNSGSIVIPSGLRLQAYIVGDAIVENTILLADDLVRPLFAAPLSCHDLPATSTWRLCQDNDQAIRLKNDNIIELGLGPAPPTNALAESINDLRNELDAVRRTLGETQQQLAEVQRSVEAVRNQPPEHEPRPPAARADANAQFFANDRLHALEEITGRTEDRINTVENSVGRTEEDLSMVKRLVVSIHSQLSSTEKPPSYAGAGPLAASRSPLINSPQPKQATGLDRRLPAVEAKLDRMDEQLSSVRKFLRSIDRRMPAVEEKTNKLQSSLEQAQGELLDARTLVVDAGVHIASLDERMGAVEEKTDRLASSFERIRDSGGEQWSSRTTPLGSPGAIHSRFLDRSRTASPDR